MLQRKFIYVLLFLLALTKVTAQVDNPFVSYDVPSQNLLKYNRFLINPTFSTVRENKSYVNLLHRNQAASFDDNNQAYFLSYSGRINDRTGLGLSLYSQQESLISNYGVLANYAYGIKLSDKSNFTFGANISYYNSGLNKNKVNSAEDDPLLNGFQSSSLISFQPGFNLSYGKFDFGLFAENLFDYNLKSNKSVTEFKDKTYSGHLQYTHQFKNKDGIMQEARLMPLARVRKVGEEDIVLGGSLILDLPKLGWLQTGYDSFYGASAGIGFNLNKRLSLGYTMEKGMSSNFDNFGVTHEISFAYSFTPNLTEDRVMLENPKEELVLKEEFQEEDAIAANEEIEKLKKALQKNDEILAELMFRQDSLEAHRQQDLERRFEMVMQMVKSETKGNRPDLEERAKKIYFINNDKSSESSQLAESNITPPQKKETKFNTIESIKQQKDVVVTTPPAKIYPKKAQDKIQNIRENKVAEKQKIKTRKFKNLSDITDGYYVIANVYKGKQYLTKFVNKLNEQGVNANYIDNPNNGLKYVYLERYNTWQEAADAYNSNLNGTYNDAVWIMNVDNSGYSNEAYVSNSTKLKEKASKYDVDVLQRNVIVKDKVASNTSDSAPSIVEGTDSGFYIIANVFANPNNANRFVKLLNNNGLNASYFINPRNNYRYVYLKKHSTWNNALESYYTKINDSYYEEMWIMRVKSNPLT
ncbi:MAG: PorP/SprF family type IX secretion system membrane protein [Cellulophaga sp.]